MGNNRIVANQSGSVIQSTQYYPFGMAFADGTNPSAQPYKFGGKELDSDRGLNLYDFHAWWQDAVLGGRFLSVDPLAEKYYSVSPYVYCMNNPVNAVDLKGDSITVLNLSKGQHIALLIQNDDGKWQYFSINGNNVYMSGKHTGGRKFNDIEEGEFDSPQHFIESTYNSKGNPDDKSINSYEYTEGYILPTTPEQDDIVRSKFTGIAENEKYSLSPFAPNHCGTAIQRSLNAVEIDTRSTYLIKNRLTGGDSYKYKSNSYYPKETFWAIIKNNPQGKYIIKQK